MDLEKMTFGEMLKTLEAADKIGQLLNRPRSGGLSTQEKGAYEEKNGTVQIAVLQRGWVYVGVFDQTGPTCRLTKASCVRTWGTTEGLGEIASKGPLSGTTLDKCPDVLFHELTVINLMSCDDSKWLKKL